MMVLATTVWPVDRTSNMKLLLIALFALAAPASAFLGMALRRTHGEESVIGGCGNATGGSITTSGGYRIHKFTSGGTFAPATTPCGVEYLVVAGGAGGGGCCGGGGGAGGYRTNVGGDLHEVTGSEVISVGAGGGKNASGNSSTFDTITSAAGGRGGMNAVGWYSGANGGSGGAAGGAGAGAIGYGNTPATTPSQGSNGGGSFYGGDSYCPG